MRPEDIRKHLKKQPFEPFRLYLSDGAFYDVPHPDFMLVGIRELVIGLRSTNKEIPGQFAFCDPMHVTRIEPLAYSKTAHGGKKKRA